MFHVKHLYNHEKEQNFLLHKKSNVSRETLDFYNIEFGHQKICFILLFGNFQKFY